jgi:hypothetical protein
MTMNETTFDEQVAFLTSMLSDDFDWEANDWPDIRDEFRKLIVTDVTPSDGDKRFDCGSYEPKGTPDSLYRILWLVGPKTVDFSDMYKTRLFTFASKDLRYWVTVELYKFELGLYFYEPEDAIDASRLSGVQSGRPGADNGVSIKEPSAVAFFDLVKAIVEATHEIYSGNNFEV